MKLQEVITFKVGKALREALQRVPNRSEFIRNALLAALDSVCPVCGGTGIMTVNQKRHWSEFQRNHSLRECGTCNEVHLVCAATKDRTHR